MRTKQRVRDLAEVWTPPHIVEEMLDLFPPEVWEPAKTFLEPACGNGNFLEGIYRRKIAAGSTPRQAVSTIYGIDISSTNVEESIQRLLLLANSDASLEPIIRHNIQRGDALTFDFTIWKEENNA